MDGIIEASSVCRKQKGSKREFVCFLAKKWKKQTIQAIRLCRTIFTKQAFDALDTSCFLAKAAL